ncbi:MAG: sulfurtransferase TusA family protein [Betaproteobacteria bacterium AqS2]|uniref:Sulfurtransferase TusA family protein n=1 Tax=Candidatus Amphirhobacter heronislandensis TaxID=1732024 RepID=A0A930XYD7_9GAMM|nr:sulfurtransferase TusA family protein [Betaproteobacteria bacterium AqS2]
MDAAAPAATIDLSGLKCPLPVLRTKKALAGLAEGERLLVIATDPDTMKDIPAFAKLAGCRLHAAERDGDRFRFVLER